MNKWFDGYFMCILAQLKNKKGEMKMLNREETRKKSEKWGVDFDSIIEECMELSEFKGKIYDEKAGISDIGEEHEKAVISENANAFYRMVWESYLNLPRDGIELSSKGKEKIKIVCELVEKVFGKYGLEVVKQVINKRLRTANLTVSFDGLITDKTIMCNLRELVKYADGFDLAVKTDTFRIELSLDMFDVCEKVK